MGTLGKLGAIGTMLGGAALATVGGSPVAGAGLIGTGAGMGKREWSDIPREQAQRALAAQTERLSPWTGLHGQLGPQGSMFESGLQGGSTGLAIGQGLSGGTAAPTDGSSGSKMLGSLEGTPVDYSKELPTFSGGWGGLNSWMNKPVVT